MFLDLSWSTLVTIALPERFPFLFVTELFALDMALFVLYKVLFSESIPVLLPDFIEPIFEIAPVVVFRLGLGGLLFFLWFDNRVW